MDIFNELAENQHFDRFINQSQRNLKGVAETVRKPVGSSTNINSPRAGGSSSNTTVQDAFEVNLRMVAENIKRKVDTFLRIDAQVDSESLLASKFQHISKINVDQSISSSELPAWFDYVMEKQYEKHQKTLSAAVSRIHQIMFPQRDILAFKQIQVDVDMLIQRSISSKNYSTGSGTNNPQTRFNNPYGAKLGENLLAEITAIECKVDAQEAKYKEFLSIVSKKIVQFCSEVQAKARLFNKGVQDSAIHIKNAASLTEYSPPPFVNAVTNHTGQTNIYYSRNLPQTPMDHPDFPYVAPIVPQFLPTATNGFARTSLLGSTGMSRRGYSTQNRTTNNFTNDYESMIPTRQIGTKRLYQQFYS